MIIKLLNWIGITRYKDDGSVRWPVSLPSKDWFMYHVKCNRKPYRFRNLPGVIKWEKGRLLPRRWGGGWLGIEIGDRG